VICQNSTLRHASISLLSSKFADCRKLGVWQRIQMQLANSVLVLSPHRMTYANADPVKWWACHCISLHTCHAQQVIRAVVSTPLDGGWVLHLCWCQFISIINTEWSVSHLKQHLLKEILFMSVVREEPVGTMELCQRSRHTFYLLILFLISLTILKPKRCVL
jgi:hypothetical protein